jgi:2-phospho-L-lactate guanylyltransferase
MTTWAIVPVKPFCEGKSRLSGVLTGTERYQLNLQCLKSTINILIDVKEIDQIIVISRDNEVLEIAKIMGASVLLEDGNNGLNKALYQANNTLDKTNDRVLVIPTDLPLISMKDIKQVLDLGSHAPVVVVVPDRRNKGTNALLVYPAGCIRYRFGENSAKKHAAEAQKRGIHTKVVDIPGIGLDLDLAEDLEFLKSTGFSLPLKAFNSMEGTIL